MRLVPPSFIALKRFLALWIFLFLATHVSGNTFVVPKVYREWKRSIGDFEISISETEKVAMWAFGQRIEPGSQVVIFVGPLRVTIPCSLNALLLSTSLFSMVMIAILIRWLHPTKRDGASG